MTSVLTRARATPAVCGCSTKSYPSILGPNWLLTDSPPLQRSEKFSKGDERNHEVPRVCQMNDEKLHA